MGSSKDSPNALYYRSQPTDSEMRTKVSLKGKIITLIILPISLPFMVPALLKHIFYNISLITEAIGAWFEQIDFYIGTKSEKFFGWIRKNYTSNTQQN
jgi:hypothetical protein